MTDRILRDWHAAYPLGLDFGAWVQALRWFLSRPATLERYSLGRWNPIGSGCAGDLLAFMIADRSTLRGRFRVVMQDGAVLRDQRFAGRSHVKRSRRSTRVDKRSRVAKLRA